MLALAAHPLGHQVVVLGPSADDPAMAVAKGIVAPFDDEAAIDALSDQVDVVTYEFENVPTAAIARIEQRVPVRPPRIAIEIGADRLAEKTLFRTLGIETAPYRAVDDANDLEVAVSVLGLPALLKTRKLGYDGKGQRLLRTDADVGGAFASLGSVPCILESVVRFDRELSIIGARGLDGSVVTYDVVENQHESGILHITRCPARGVPAPALAAAHSAIEGILARLDYVGVLAVELFLVGDRVLANEIAPRVHNSGHHTIEGAETSQFENHIRAITGAALGSTRTIGATVMVNLVGRLPDLTKILAIPNAHVHVYGKPPYAARKLGHITLRGRDEAEAAQHLPAVLALEGWTL